MRTRRSRRGGAMIEFALASTILIPAMIGTFQYGYSFYLYNQLEAAVSNGARYGCNRTYRNALGSTDVDKGKSTIANMVVYGMPSPPSGTPPVVLGLTPSNVVVTYTLGSTGVPISIRVAITNFSIDALFKTYTFYGKPYVDYAYVGRYSPNGSEP